MRRTARENAFKIIFEKLVSGGTGKITCAVLTHMMSADENDYFNTLLQGVGQNREFLTEIIGRYARGYDVDRIYKIDLSIMLIAAYEILFLTDVPDKVSINEAVELAKVYSTDNSPAFVNGILASVVKDKPHIIDEYEEKKKNAADATENENEKQLSAKPTDDSDSGGLLINEDIGYDG